MNIICTIIYSKAVKGKVAKASALREPPGGARRTRAICEAHPGAAALRMFVSADETPKR
jgi:hypothetical protein